MSVISPSEEYDLTELKEYAQFIIDGADRIIQSGFMHVMNKENNLTNRELLEQAIGVQQSLLYRLMCKRLIQFDNVKFHYTSVEALIENVPYNQHHHWVNGS